MASEPDELFTLRTLYWLGSYQAAINEATGLSKIPASLVSEKDEFVYRSFLAMGQYSVVLHEIKDKPTTSVGND
jgi:coatomer protein complex subunit epsilon